MVYEIVAFAPTIRSPGASKHGTCCFTFAKHSLGHGNQCTEGVYPTVAHYLEKSCSTQVKEG